MQQITELGCQNVHKPTFPLRVHEIEANQSKLLNLNCSFFFFFFLIVLENQLGFQEADSV